MKLKRFRTGWALFALAVALGGATPALAILQKGQPAPPLKVTTTSGQQVTLANYKGHVLVLDFFATWCGPCKEALPHLLDLNRTYGKQGLQILGLSVDDSGEKGVRDFVAARQLNYPVALADDDLQGEYGLRSVPTIFVINKKGVVAEKFQGFSEDTGKSLEILIRKLLAE